MLQSKRSMSKYSEEQIQEAIRVIKKRRPNLVVTRELAIQFLDDAGEFSEIFVSKLTKVAKTEKKAKR